MADRYMLPASMPERSWRGNILRMRILLSVFLTPVWMLRSVTAGHPEYPMA